MTQPELFSTVLRVSGTIEADWNIERRTTQDLIEEGHKMVKGGDSSGHVRKPMGRVSPRPSCLSSPPLSSLKMLTDHSTHLFQFKIIFGVTYQQDMGGDYSKLLHNEMLGLGKEDLDEVVRLAIDSAEPEWVAGATLPK